MFKDLDITPSSNAQIPTGVSDLFWSEAYDRRKLEFDLLQLFRSWGYQDVIAPTFEFSDTFTERSDSKLAGEMYRFLDRDGSTLALRVDMTIPIARLVGTRLYDLAMPQRFCYGGSVFRYVDPQVGRQREFYQAGIELFGSECPQADAEVVALASMAVEASGIDTYQLVLGHIKFFEGLIKEMGLSPHDNAKLQFAVDRNSEAHLRDFMRETPLTSQQRRTLEELPSLRGQNAQGILARAEAHCLNHEMYQSVTNLRAICGELSQFGLDGRLYLDLSEIHNLGYYTGLTFEVLAPQQGFPIGSGGRYDSLLSTFGAEVPAVGVALELDRILLTTRLQEPSDVTVHNRPADVMVGAQHDPNCYATLKQLRDRNIRVVSAIGLENRAEIVELANRHMIDRVLLWRDNGFAMIDCARPTEVDFAGPAEVERITHFILDSVENRRDKSNRHAA